MPRLSDGLTNYNAGTFQFSAEKIDARLSSTEYTLVSIICDRSGSITPFADDISEMVKEIIHACRKSPRADYLMVRLVTFSNNNMIEEIHGFKLLMNCNPDDYTGVIKPYNMTALYDAAYQGIISSAEYSKQLIGNDFASNSIVFIITDGLDSGPGSGGSSITPAGIKSKLDELKMSESMGEIVTILVGVNTTQNEVISKLEEFKNNAGLTQFVNMGEATKQRLAKLAGFVSKSVVSSSTALAQGNSTNLQSVTF